MKRCLKLCAPIKLLFFYLFCQQQQYSHLFPWEIYALLVETFSLCVPASIDRSVTIVHSPSFPKLHNGDFDWEHCHWIQVPSHSADLFQMGAYIGKGCQKQTRASRVAPPYKLLFATYTVAYMYASIITIWVKNKAHQELYAVRTGWAGMKSEHVS